MRSSARALDGVFSSKEKESPRGVLALCRALYTLEEMWHRVVGDRVASLSAPVCLEHGVLLVVVSSSAALHDLRFKKYSISQKIRSGIGIELTDIRFEMGKIRRRSRARATESRAPRKIVVEESDVERIIGAISRRREGLDPTLARAIARCIAAAEQQRSRR